jgi:hypothetical protein
MAVEKKCLEERNILFVQVIEQEPCMTAPRMKAGCKFVFLLEALYMHLI